MKEKDLKEDVTQASNVDGGKVTIFGSNNPNEENWYKQLFELDDVREDNDYCDCYDDDIEECDIEDYTIED